MADDSPEWSASGGASSTQQKKSKQKSQPPRLYPPIEATDDDFYFDNNFKPLNGDIIIYAKLVYDKVTKLVQKPAIALYSDENNMAQLHPGDLLLRRGMFELNRLPSTGCLESTDEWCWKDLRNATLHVYWPNYHSLGSWFSVGECAITQCLKPIPDPEAFRRVRKLADDPNSPEEFEESQGDIVIRMTKIVDPTRPWGRIYKAWQLQDTWDRTNWFGGDIVVQSRGHYFPPYQGHPEERDPEFRILEPLFRVEADCCWYEPVDKKWLFGGQDVFCYKCKATDNWIIQERFRSVPKPGDILFTIGENLLLPVDKRKFTGGHAQLYNEPRFFYDGDPPLKKVNVTGPGNMAVRFGHFDQHWNWTPHPTLELFHFHEVEKAWYTTGPVSTISPWDFPPDYSFERTPKALNSIESNLEPREGDILIRQPHPPPPKQVNPLIGKSKMNKNNIIKDRFPAPKTQSAPNWFWKRIMKVLPYNLSYVQKHPLKQGDSLLRAGFELAGPYANAKYYGTAELYTMYLDHWDRKVWLFRGRDKVLFGGPEFQPTYHQPRKEEVVALFDITRDRGVAHLAPQKSLLPPGYGQSEDVVRSIWGRSKWTKVATHVPPQDFKNMLKIDDKKREKETKSV